MFLFLLLQSLADKPAAVAIAHDGGNSALIQAVIMSIATGVAGYLVRAFVTKPAERAEQYEEAKFKSLESSLAEHKASYQLNLREWLTWREHQSERTTKLELQVDHINRTLTEKIEGLGEDVSETKEITQDIRESLAGLKVQMEQTIGKWTK